MDKTDTSEVKLRFVHLDLLSFAGQILKAVLFRCLDFFGCQNSELGCLQKMYIAQN